MKKLIVLALLSIAPSSEAMQRSFLDKYGQKIGIVAAIAGFVALCKLYNSSSERSHHVAQISVDAQPLTNQILLPQDLENSVATSSSRIRIQPFISGTIDVLPDITSRLSGCVCNTPIMICDDSTDHQQPYDIAIIFVAVTSRFLPEEYRDFVEKYKARAYYQQAILVPVFFINDNVYKGITSVAADYPAKIFSLTGWPDGLRNTQDLPRIAQCIGDIARSPQSLAAGAAQPAPAPSTATTTATAVPMQPRIQQPAQPLAAGSQQATTTQPPAVPARPMWARVVMPPASIQRSVVMPPASIQRRPAGPANQQTDDSEVPGSI